MLKRRSFRASCVARIIYIFTNAFFIRQFPGKREIYRYRPAAYKSSLDDDKYEIIKYIRDL